MRNKKNNQFKVVCKKTFAIYMVFTLFFEIAFPTASMALTGGPSQPEVESFEPVGTSEMVDPFSGDFTYNIPLLDVDGYPVNISYHSNVTTDQEASWVGLGWNINPGVINRGMRGIPDDFKGENIVKEINMKPNRTFGLSLGVDFEFLGLDGDGKKSLGGLGYELSVRFNNYTGVGVDQTISGHVPLNLGSGAGGSVGLGLTSSSDNGLTVQPNLSFSAKMNKNDKQSAKLGLSIGTSFNSRGGLSHLTVGLSIEKAHQKTKQINGKEKVIGNSNGHFGGSSSFNIGMPTYTPQLTLPFQNYAISTSFKIGGELAFAFINGKIGAYFASQTLMSNTLSQPAYGYLNADEGVKYDNAVMDFNREKDGPFSPSTPALPVTNFTYDLLSVSGQGVSGSYRPFRSDYGHVFDPHVSNISLSGTLGVEVGLGELFKVGVDASVSDVTSQSGRWKNDDGSNPAFNSLYYTQNSSDPTYERYYYKEANEKSIDADTTYISRADSAKASSYTLQQNSKFNTVITGNMTDGTTGPSGTLLARQKREQVITMKTRDELNKGYGVMPNSHLSKKAQPYHIGEITSVTPDGKRYVYGIAAYNNTQEETTFAVGIDEFGNNGYASSALDSYSGLINYTSGSNSMSNTHGVDNYYSNTIMPPYAHSYLLTAVLSSDYVDVDGVPGPSVNDLGTYTKFNYTKVDSTYKWRTPYGANIASFSDGLKWSAEDDKGSYVYGEKELWYLSSIETKNYIAIFNLTNRNEGCGVLGRDGGLDVSHPMKKLDKISLYTQVNYKANQANSSIALIPIKEIHFTYNYELCPGIENNSSPSSPLGNGKLTLKEISFSYRSSSKGRLSPYKFTYSSNNPSYNIKGYDRWGNYKPQDATFTTFPGTGSDANELPGHSGISNSEFPYVIQDTTFQNPNARAWALTKIGLPSGGSINVDYESDDYAYVQNKQAGQMFKIVGVSTNTTTPSSTSSVITSTLAGSSYLVIQLQNPITGSNTRQRFYDQYLSGLDYIYFRFLYHMSTPGPGPTYEYVPGYIPISNLSDYGVYSSGGGQYAYIKFASLTTNDNGTGTSICPITKAALQFGRLNESKNMWITPGFNSTSSFGEQLLEDFVASDFVKNIADAVQGPNQALYNPSGLHQCCKNFYLNKSWMRLNNPNKHKLGGGSRVRRITTNDEWNDMTINAMPAFSYGQEYSYNNEDGTSSGVASYEPMLGGDENPWRTPVFFDITHLLAPNDELYQEEPYGECFFPSPSVGYGRVTVTNIKHTGVSKHATGYSVHEFWTAKDFPTITSRTDLQAVREKTDALSISSFLHIDTKDYMTASQGFYVELNDMHGKPKGQKVYQENISVPISSIEYDYQKEPYLNGSYKLSNTAQVVSQTGAINSQELGVFFDFTTDFREESSKTISGSLNFNTDAMDLIFVVLPIPTIWPGFSSDKTRFRSAAVTKVVNRFGIQTKTIAKDLGSTVETDNLAYDSETGGVILTKTITDYDDPIYNLNYPAYWYYDGMGPAYSNVGISMNGVSFSGSSGTCTSVITNANSYFVPGDEIEMDKGSTHIKAWVLSTNSTSITVEDKNGNYPSVAGSYNIMIVRSGKRNDLTTNMATITSLQNPISGINSNGYSKVINASGTEYSEQWNVFCECTSTYAGADQSKSYVTGAKGNWRPKRSFSYLTGRTQTNYDGNTNTRKDGVYMSYNPLYKKAGMKWKLDTTNWTFSSKVTIVNPNGQEIENIDALGRYSAATYGYDQTFATAVSANAKHREIGFDNAEDYSLASCADKHFKFTNPVIDSSQSHTGRKSIRVSSSSPLEMTKVLATTNCSTETPCNIDITKGFRDFYFYTFSGPGAQTPLTISYVVTNGSPSFTINSSGQLQINSAVNAVWSAIVTVTGATGCSEKFLISNPSTN